MARAQIVTRACFIQVSPFKNKNTTLTCLGAPYIVVDPSLICSIVV